MSIEQIAAAKEVGGLVAGPAIKRLKKWINYVRTCDENVQEFQKLYGDLPDKQKSLEEEVHSGELNNQEADSEVTKWIKSVNEFMASKEECKELLKDEEARRKAEQCCFGFCWSPRYRHHLSRKAEKMANEIETKMKDFRELRQHPVMHNKRPLKSSSHAPSAFCRGLESREKTLEDILEVLRDDKVNRIGIHGMGGAGKTTLIQELARRVEDDKSYNAVIIAEISQFPDYKRIQDQIADRIGLTNLGQFQSIEERAVRLGNRLKGLKKGKRLYDDEEENGPTKEGDKVGAAEQNLQKVATRKKLDKAATRKKLDKAATKRNTYKEMDGVEEEGQNQDDNHGENELKEDRGEKPESEEDKEGRSGKLLVILDNIWKRLDLHLIGIPYELEKDLGCKIIVISRSEDVCKAMDALDSCIFKVGDLKEDEAWILFRERVGKNDNDFKDYEEISKKLLKKCSRLPLSINVLADTLRNQTLPVWERILRHLKMPVHGETLGVYGDTYSIIEMSYDYLGNKEKRMFFLLCCLFPPGSSVHIADLLKYGIGMRLFQYVNSIVEAIDLAYKWLDDLKSLSLLAEVDIKKGVIQIHDDVREAGKSFAAKGELAFHVGPIPRWLNKDSYGKYAVISIMSDNSYEYLDGQILPKLQLLRSLGSRCSKLGEDYFSGMQNLRVLDMSKCDIKSLPSSLEKLENLETLLLEYCSLQDITQVSKLVKLRALSLRFSNIMRLPKEMKALEELKLLDLTNCEQLKDIPSGIFPALLQLEGLYMKHSFSDWTISGSMASLSELKSLPLHILEITIQRISQLLDDDFPIINLSSYNIDIAVSLPPPPAQDLLLSRDLQLGEVDARDLGHEGWMSLMSRAESLYLEQITGLKNIAPHLGEYGWREIKRITVSECHEMDCIISSKATYQSVVFPKLEMLRLEDLSAFKAIYYGMPPPHLFSNLQELTLIYLTQLRSSVIAVQHATRLKVLELKGCQNLKSVFFAPIAMQPGRGEEKSSDEIILPCLEKLILANLEAFQGLFEVTSVDDQKLHVFPKQVVFPVLDKIKLENLQKIEQLWQMATGQEFATTFPKLRSVSLKYMDQLKNVWRAELSKTSFSFEKLKKLKICECGSLEFICPPSVAIGLHELELLRIFSSKELKQVISTEKGGGESDGVTSSKKMTMISFPKLLTIDFVRLRELIYFYQGKLEFPMLKNLKLVTLLKLKTLTKVEPQESTEANKKKEIPKDDGILFNSEVQFPCLEVLYVERLDGIEGLWDIEVSQISMMYPNIQNLTLLHMKILKYVWTKELIGATQISINLKEIEIRSCGAVESLFPPSAASNTEVKVVKVEFPELQTIKVSDSNNFKYILEGNVNLEFPALKTIGLRYLGELMAFAKLEKSETLKGGVENEDHDVSPIPLFNGKIYVPYLEELQVYKLPKIEKLWGMTSSDEFSQAFASLQTLVIENLAQLKHVWSYDPTEENYYFGSLENMKILYCHEIESLFSCSTGTSSPSQLQNQKVISFPKLQRLVLIDLESFRCVFQGYSNMEFQALKELIINELPLVKTLVELGNCDAEMEKKTENAKEGSEKGEGASMDAVLFKGNVEFSSLEELKIKYMPMLESIHKTKGENAIPCSSIFPKLKTLHLTGGREFKLKQLPEAMLHKLSSLAIRNFNELKCLVSSSGGGDALVKSLSELVNLEELIIKECKLLEELFGVEGQDETVMLSSLKNLKISGLPMLKFVQWRMIPNLRSLDIADSLGRNEFLIPASEVAGGLSLQSLESVAIRTCADMESIVGDDEKSQIQKDDCEILFPKLKEVRFSWMNSLYTFNSTSFSMHLPSLASIAFISCRSLRSFSVGPMVISQLSNLEVDNKTVMLDGDTNIILQREFDSNYPVAKHWPPKVMSKLHEEHPLWIKKWRLYDCGGCQGLGGHYSYTCRNCDFDLHPHCTLNESQLIVVPDEMKVGKDLPKTVKHQTHSEHELKLVAGRMYLCDGCDEPGELFGYCCEECDFALHPKCALQGPSTESQP